TPSHSASRPRPNGVTAPAPVMTTRRRPPAPMASAPPSRRWAAAWYATGAMTAARVVAPAPSSFARPNRSAGMPGGRRAMGMHQVQPGEPLEYGLGSRPVARSEARTVFGQTMFLVAVALGFLAAGAWIGRDISWGWAIAAWVGALVLVVAMSFSRKAGRGQLGMGLLFGVGVLFGIALGPTLAEYASAPGGAELIGQAAGLTALFIAGTGTVGYLTKRDLSGLGRICLFALLGLIAFGLVAMFVAIPY